MPRRPTAWTASSSARRRRRTAFRRLDQEAVDAIVWAMVVAGLEHAVELAELAMEETGFGVFEDKVSRTTSPPSSSTTTSRTSARWA